jgi:hypothetical protein
MVLLFAGNDANIAILSVFNFNISASGGYCITPVSPISQLMLGITVPMLYILALAIVFVSHLLLWLLFKSKPQIRSLAALFPASGKFHKTPYLRTLCGIFIFSCKLSTFFLCLHTLHGVTSVAFDVCRQQRFDNGLPLLQLRASGPRVSRGRQHSGCVVHFRRVHEPGAVVRLPVHCAAWCTGGHADCARVQPSIRPHHQREAPAALRNSVRGVSTLPLSRNCAILLCIIADLNRIGLRCSGGNSWCSFGRMPCPLGLVYMYERKLSFCAAERRSLALPL